MTPIKFALASLRARRAASARSRDAGFTLVEVMVSLVLFGVVAGASVTAITTSSRTNNTARDRVTAANLAQADIQQARALRYPSYPAAVASHPVTVGTKRYTVNRSVSTTCPSVWTPGAVTSMQVTTTVTWPGTTTPVVVATEISC
jgi:prepilin-type N-terminal cleavage/methylation domain-containing protein